MSSKDFTILNTSCLSELSRIMAAKTLKKSVSLTDSEVQTFLKGEENQYTKSILYTILYTISIPTLYGGQFTFST